LSGGAGTGKSSVANSVAAIFDQIGRLGASFRFNQDKDRLNSPDYLFTNIAYQLAYFNNQLKGEIVSVLGRNGNIQMLPLQNQVQKLISDTTCQVDMIGPVVIVIDALDECGNSNTRASMLDAFAAAVGSLPAYLKVVITSRDEHDIRTVLGHIGTKKDILLANRTRDDIRAYIHNEMAKIRRHQQQLPRGWPGLTNEQKLADLASDLFIWASVACKFIYEQDAEVQLSTLLDPNLSAGGTLDKLDKLYLHILLRTYETGSYNDPAAFRYVVGSILMLKNPLGRELLDVLLGLSRSLISNPLSLPGGTSIKLTSAEMIISSIRSLLRSEDGPIRVLHLSVSDFFTDPRRCTDQRFSIDKAAINCVLSFRCLAIMNGMLKMDICGIRDHTLFNSEVDELEDRGRRYIPEALRYACRFFAQHINDCSGLDQTTLEELDRFISIHLLRWVEVMSLLGKLSGAEVSVRLLLKYAKVCIYMHRRILSDSLLILFFSSVPAISANRIYPKFSAMRKGSLCASILLYRAALFPHTRRSVLLLRIQSSIKAFTLQLLLRVQSALAIQTGRHRYCGKFYQDTLKVSIQ
jgi:hypothetical protein